MSNKTWQKIFSVFLLIGMFFSLAQPRAVSAKPQPIQSNSSQGLLAPEPDEKALVKVEPQLLDEISLAGSGDFIARFTEQADLSPAYAMDWQARGEFVYNTLKEVAVRSQARAIEYLVKYGVDYQTFIAGNDLYVKAGDLDAITNLAGLDEVDSIRAPRTYQIDPVEVRNLALDFTWVGELVASHTQPTVVNPASAAPQAVTDWGITDTNADDFWTTFGFQGDGIVVANIDTGVQWNHPALVDSFKCGSDPTDPACWADPSNICGAGGACDNNGHGSHTMGTMVANNDQALAYIAGMAPDAQWIACKGCESSSCSDLALNTCADWIVAPDGDPANRPNVVNNSWGGGGGDNWYLAKVNAWRAAGIFPAFSSGNPGSTCGAIGSPSDYQESFATANHQSNRTINSTSGRGPSTFGDDPYTKPNISAPGTSICSTVPTDGWSCGYSGTSMASPHSAGAVALLWSCNPSLIGQIDQTFQILQDNADAPQAGNCGAPPDGEGNYTFGYGYLNVLAAGLQNCGAAGTLAGNVTDGANPIEGANIMAALNMTQTYQTVTDMYGDYSLSVLVGTYTVDASAFGYLPEQATGVVVYDGITTTQDFALTMAPSHVLSATVVDANTGWPLYAQVTLGGTPWDPIWNDPVTGHFEVVLPEGITYTLGVDAWVPGYLHQDVEVAPLSGDVEIVISLDIDEGSCTAPGYSIVGGIAENFDAASPPALPGGWAEMIVTDPGTDPNWDTRVGTRYPSGYTAHSVPNLIYFNSFSAPTGAQARLYTQAGFDMTTLSSYNLSFWMFRDDGYATSNETIQVQISLNGGASWVNVGSAFPRYSASGDYWEVESVDLSAYSAETNLMLGFLATSGYGNDIHLDDILLGSTCATPTGGLVVGNVYNANTGTPLVGAEVSNDSGGMFTAAATPDDPNVDDAFYTLYSPSGLHDFTAAFTGYDPDTESVDVVAGDTVEANFNLDAPWMLVDPVALTTSVELGTTAVEPLTITNDGGVDLDFQLSEKKGDFIPLNAPTAGEDVLVVASSTTIATALETALTGADYTWLQVNTTQFAAMTVDDLLAYQAVFYAGYPTDTNAQGILTKAYLDAGGSMLLSDNDFGYSQNATPLYQTYFQATYLGDNGGDLLTGEDIMAGINPDITPDPYPDYYTTGANATVIFRYNGGTGNGQAAGSTIMRNGYRVVYLAFDYNTIVAPADSLAIVENAMSFLVNPNLVPWLSEDPITGTITAGGDQLVDVTFDASVPDVSIPGTYTADLVVKSNDPLNNRQSVPVEMVVTAPADWGELQGVVSTTGYCDNNPAPVEGAMVMIEGGDGYTATIQTDASGIYHFWVDSDHNPITMTVTAVDQSDGSAVVDILPSGVVVQDFVLRWQKACVSASPDSLEGSVELGDMVTVTLTLQNSGAVAADFTLIEQDGGYSPNQVENLQRVSQSTDRLEIVRLPDGSVDCAAYENSIYKEPVEVAEACNKGLNSPVIVGSNPTAPTDTGFAQDIGYISDNFVSFLLNDFSGQTVVGTSTDAYYGMDFDPQANLLYALNDTTGQLGTIDLTTGTFTGLVPCPAPVDIWTGLSIASDGTFYASTATDLYIIDPSTGVSTLIGPFGTTLMIDIAINPAGEMYGHDIGTDSIYSIDTNTGAATLIGLTGYNANYAQGMDFDNDDGTLYIFLYQGSGANVYGTVNLTTGVVTPLAVSNPQGEFEGAVQVAAALDVPWLSEDPITGTLDADTGEVIVDVTMDSSVVAQPGIYTAFLKVKTADPMHAMMSVPVTMTVSPTADYGLLVGTVTSLGYCDAAPAPIEGAEVMIEASDGMTYTVMTDANGEYSRWLDIAGNNYIVSVTVTDHEFGIEPDVEIISQGETTVDFDLRVLEPCVSVAPEALEVDVPLGYDMTVVLDVMNNGAQSTDFTLQEVPATTILGMLGVSRPVVTGPAPKVVTIGDNLLSTNPNIPAGTQVPAKPRSLAADEVTITHSLDQSIVALNSVSCNAGGLHTDNSYLRVFDLAAFGIDTDFNITQVEIGIETASGAIGTQPATVNLYTLDGALLWANLTLIGTADVIVADQDLSILSMDVTGSAPAGSQLVVEFFTPNGQGAGNSLFVGSNDLGQTGPTYLAAADCAVTEPTDVGSIGFPGMMLVMNVTGELGSSDIPWLAEDPITGTVAHDSSFPVDVTFTAFPTMTVGGVYTGSLIVKTDDPMSPKIEIPVTMNVVEPVYGIEISADQSGDCPPGLVYTYTVMITNTSNFSTDSFTVTVGTHVYDTMLGAGGETSLVVGPLAMGDSVTFQVMVHVPADAHDGDHDTAQITVTSAGDPTETAITNLTTNVVEVIPPMYYINLPLIWKAP